MEDRGREDHSGCDDHACAVCDLGFSDTPDRGIEVKLARLGRDNGTYEDAAIKKILSLHSEDRSAVTDCDKLAGSSFAGKCAILIYGFEDPQRPLSWLIGAFGNDPLHGGGGRRLIDALSRTRCTWHPGVAWSRRAATAARPCRHGLGAAGGGAVAS